MAKVAFKMFLIPLVLASCLDNAAATPPSLFHKTIVCDHCAQKHHWDGSWFEKFDFEGFLFDINTLWDEDDRLTVTDRMRMLSQVMGCAYGPRLNYFFLLTFKIIDECNGLQHIENQPVLADICKGRLQWIIGRSKSVVLKLILTIKSIYELIRKDRNMDKFYNALLPLEDFPNQQTTIDFYAPLKGGPVINGFFTTGAESLKTFLRHTCVPKFVLFDITKLTDDYYRSNNQDPIYAYLLGVLYGHIDFIEKHLIQLGFHHPEIPDFI